MLIPRSPLSESLQAYARRRGLTPSEAYADWHGQLYPSVDVASPDGPRFSRARGPGLALHLRDLPRLPSGEEAIGDELRRRLDLPREPRT